MENTRYTLIKFELFLTFARSLNYVITSKATQDTYPAVAALNNRTGATIAITDAKLYVSVITIWTQGDILFQQLKTEFKWAIKWNKYLSKMSNQTKNSNLKYITDPKFHKVNILFVLLYENEDNRTSYEK